MRELYLCVQESWACDHLGATTAVEFSSTPSARTAVKGKLELLAWDVRASPRFSAVLLISEGYS